MKEEFIEIGYTQKAHGLKGEIKIFIEDAFLDEMEHLEVLFLEVRGNVLPFFIEEKRGVDMDIVKLEDVNDKEAAGKLKASKIFVKESDLRYWEEEEEQELFYNHCTGYEVIDVIDGSLGVIEEVLEYPQQELAIIMVNGREILLPLNEHTVLEMDADKKQIKVEMPEGLLDLHKDDEEEAEEE
jgi:16S rRNA processing protein RimM